MSDQPILIAGAGPTGLVLALALARRGVPFRIISKAGGPGEHSRAMVVQARTLEFYRQFGFADEMVAQGVPLEAVHLREGAGREVMSVDIADIGAGQSPYSFPLCYPQDDHERFLLRKLEAAGGAVEWGTTLTGFSEDVDGVAATIERDGGGRETVRTPFLCGCDGAHSVVRQTAGVGFPGGSYDQLFYVADVTLEGGFRRDLSVGLGDHTLALLLPVRSRGVQRLIGLVPDDVAAGRDATFADVQPHAERLLGITVSGVNWFSTYHVHHRVADRFRIGRAFLLGDAGHIHSPAGGQGMNTGIGDAINLGWKLAEVVQGRAPDALLDSYEVERIGFARALVATTDRAFTPMVARGWRGELTRRVLAPAVLAVGSRIPAGRHAFFRTLSQIHISYEDGPLAEGKAGQVSGGDRLPWVAECDNFAPLRSLDWQVHVYGAVAPGFEAACAAAGAPVHGFAWSGGADKVGLRRDAAYLVRPDGYVALAQAAQDGAAMAAFLRRWRPG